jgi:beta-N-acetylhexosaminidase
LYDPVVSPANNVPRAVIFGLEGTILTDRERRLFAETSPLGFILFARNCEAPRQVRTLVSQVRETVGRVDAPVLIDQEGGRVQRIGPPHWRAAPAAARFAELAGVDEMAAVEAARINARMLAAELHDLEITVDCAPVLDIPQPGANEVIGDRAAGHTPGQAAMLGWATCDGLLAGGVLPVIKHIPGHGRAMVDSHKSLPVVTASRAELERIDFAPFQALNSMPWAMTAHVVYTALDPSACATVSPIVIDQIIRGALDFNGLLISDDICMQALGGPPDERAAAALHAGCDLVLHCNGAIAEMDAVSKVVPTMSMAAQERLERGEAMRRRPEPFDMEAAIANLNGLLTGRAA